MATGQDWLSRTLRELRTAAGMSQTTAAKMAGLSQPHITRFERGLQVPSEDQARRLCAAYRAPAGARRDVLRTVRDLRSEVAPARIALNRGGVWKIQERIKRVERASSVIRGFQPLVIPGLFQTPGYMLAIFSDGGSISPADLERSMAERAARQEVVLSGREIRYVIPEAALMWQAASPQVMADQLDHLAALIPQTRSGVIPWTRAVGTFPSHGFHLYDQREVIVGTRTGTSFITGPRDVAEYARLFEALEVLAVHGEQAQEIIAAVASRYRSIT